MTFPGGYSSPYPFMDPEKMTIVSDPPLPGFDEQPQMWITTEHGKAIRQFVEGGGSVWFFHNASYISGANEDFRHVEGALKLASIAKNDLDDRVREAATERLTDQATLAEIAKTEEAYEALHQVTQKDL